jgi:hypothetical protein
VRRDGHRCHPEGEGATMLDDFSESPADLITTPFEDWCAARQIHPETLSAWDHYTRQTPIAS